MKIVLHSALIAGDRVYVFGGVTENNYAQDAVYSAEIIMDADAGASTNHTLGAWRVEAWLPAPLFRTAVSQYIVGTTTYIYVIGGFDGKKARKEIYRGKLENGHIKKWETIRPLRRPLYYHAVLIMKNEEGKSRLVIFGGKDGKKSYRAVYSAKIDKDGDLGDWKDERGLPLSLSRHTMVEHDGRVYLIGGDHEGIPQSQVYISTKGQYPKAKGAQAPPEDPPEAQPTEEAIGLSSVRLENEHIKSVTANQVITYHIYYKNGQFPLNNVKFTSIIPAGFEYVAESTQIQPATVADSRTTDPELSISWTLPDPLLANISGEISYRLRRVAESDAPYTHAGVDVTWSYQGQSFTTQSNPTFNPSEQTYLPAIRRN